MKNTELKNWLIKHNLTKDNAALVFGVSRSSMFKMLSSRNTKSLRKPIIFQYELLNNLSKSKLKSVIQSRLEQVIDEQDNQVNVEPKNF
ncbi:hypothetical protein [uncultured Pseudoalteromonas sp.]|uniref:hypothetical protein n=1 Tax=uncultured Pseudoalteromonas sp. TaxID=114053 RepID=UPI0025949671|nr:hypothetical protein [uncultured Pseudoalteromonas sp.]